MFIGRKRELQVLSDLYERNHLTMAVIYGRRRVGKSTLITEFIKDKRAVFYTASKVGRERNLELFSRQAASVLDPAYANAVFSETTHVFDFITEKTGDEKLILVIDELPYWAEKDESLLSVLQKYIDVDWHDKNMMIILCGSALSFMENKVMSEKSPLFGRRDTQIRLEPFNYLEAALFVPEYSLEEKALCYGVTGGVARYLALIDSSKNMDENIKKLFFHTDGYLYDEPRNLLSQEFSDIALVNNVIEQIASGENTLNTIAGKVRESEPTVSYTLGRLIAVGLVEKKKCITEETNKKKTQYVLKDSMFKFWYQFIPKAGSVIEMGQGEVYYDRIVKPVLHSFMGGVFEEMCRYFTLAQGISGKYGGFITEAGSWWGTEQIVINSTKKYQSADIDVVAISQSDKTAVVGECKYKNEKIDKSVYETLLRRSRVILNQYKITKYLLFSLSGYTEWYDTLISDTEVLRYTLADLYVL